MDAENIIISWVKAHQKLLLLHQHKNRHLKFRLNDAEAPKAVVITVFLNDDFMSNPAFYSFVYGEMFIQ